MHFKIFGGVEAVGDDGRVLAVNPGKTALLLAILLCRPNEPIAVPELAGALWGDQPPASAAENLRSYVHQLRRVLGRDAVVRRGTAYSLVTDPQSVDVGRFDELIARADEARERGDRKKAQDLFRTASALAHGQPFGPLAEEPALAGHVLRLKERRLAAHERGYELELELGAHAEIVSPLTDLAADNPYRERLHAQLMRALAGAGRKADALKAYRDLRATLVADLGIEPGREIDELQQEILREDPKPAPAELPPAVTRFIGRSDELKRLGELTADAEPPALPVAAVVGPPGVGKTALVVQWAHDAASGFPDGTIFLDLHGFHRRAPMSADEAIARLLVSLGVDARAVPPGFEQAVTLYRSTVAGRRILLVLDNARSAEHVRDLLPGSPAAAVVVTSRNRLTGLVAGHGARSMTIEPLRTADAVGLLSRFLDDVRVIDDPAAAADLVEACDRLPLAVCITAANLAEDPHRAIATHLAELRADRFAALEVDGERDLRVAATFDQSYESLGRPEQRTFRLLGALPCHDFTAPAIAAAIGGTDEQARLRLGRLSRAHLVEQRAAGRYAPHDLIREYANRRAGKAEARTAITRLAEYYLRRCDSAARAMYPQMIRLPYPGGLARDTEPAPAAEAAAWLNEEIGNIVALCLSDQGALTWHIADLLRGYFWGRGLGDHWYAVATAAATATEPRARTMAELSLGNYYQRRHDLAAASARYAQTLRLSREASWPQAEAVAESAIGSLAFVQGDFSTAVEHLENSLAVTRRSGGRPAGDVYNLLAGAQFSLGRLGSAGEYLRTMIELAREDNARTAEALARGNLALVLCQQGLLDQAHGHAAEALRMAREIDEPLLETVARVSLATVLTETGDPQAARQHAEHAVERSSAAGDTGGECQAHNALAPAYRALGRIGDAITHHEIALRLAGDSSDVYVEIDSTTGLAAAHLAQGDLLQAASLGEKAVARARDVGYQMLLSRALTVLAEIYARQGRSSGDLVREALHRRDLSR